jgi:hypothetical protein
MVSLHLVSSCVGVRRSACSTAERRWRLAPASDRAEQADDSTQEKKSRRAYVESAGRNAIECSRKERRSGGTGPCVSRETCHCEGTQAERLPVRAVLRPDRNPSRSQAGKLSTMVEPPRHRAIAFQRGCLAFMLFPCPVSCDVLVFPPPGIKARE